MKLEINKDNPKELEMFFENNDEMYTITEYLKPKTRNHKFSKQVGRWNGQVSFVRKHRFVPIQLWQFIYSVCKKHGYKFDFVDVKKHTTIEIDIDKLKSIYQRALLSDPELKYDDDQFDTIVKFIRNKYNKQNVSTAYGKTLILFVACVYLSNVENSKILLITTKPSLSFQIYSDFVGYSKHVQESKKIFNVMAAGNDLPEYEDYDIVIANFLLLQSKEKIHFERFTDMINDEVHRASSKSYKIINNNCVNLKSTRGVTGTMYIDFSAETHTMIVNSGFTSKIVKKKELINSGRATNGKIITKYINSLNPEQSNTLHKYFLDETDNIKKLNLERRLVRDSYPRFSWMISDIRNIQKEHKNGIIFFKDVENQYGKRIQQALLEYKDFSVFYIDQHVKEKTRGEIYKYANENENCIIVASYDIMSTGINVKRLRFGYMAEPVKSQITVGQVVGRFMRLFEDKEFFYLYDIVDVITSVGRTKQNYYHKWYIYDRKVVYDSDKFEILEQRININHGLNF